MSHTPLNERLCKRLQSEWSFYARSPLRAHPFSCRTLLLLLETWRLCRYVHSTFYNTVSMPQQRLDFTPTSRRFTPAQSNSDLALSNSPLRDSDEGDERRVQVPITIAPPISSSSAPCLKPRTSWVFSHMPDEDRETRYYNQRTGKRE